MEDLPLFAADHASNQSAHPDVYLSVDYRKDRVHTRSASDAERWGFPRPEKWHVAELDADVIQKFSEA